MAELPDPDLQDLLLFQRGALLFFALTRASRGEGWQRLRAARLSLSLLPGLMLHQLLWPLLEALQVVIGLKVTRGFLEDGKDWRLFRIHHLIRSEPGSR